MKKLNFVILIAVMSIVACKPQTSTVNVRAEADTLRSLEDQWSAAILNKDKEKIFSMFAPDAVSMSQNQPICQGAENLRKHIDAMFEDTTELMNTYTYKIETIEVAASGDLAYVRGSDRVSKKTFKGTADEIGKWVDIWKKTDGKWKVVVSIWNGDEK